LGIKAPLRERRRTSITQGAHGGAFQAALEIWKGVELLSGELAGEPEEPLRSGIGIHIGTAVVGLVRTDESQSLQFLGDTGNVAAKLEAKTKELGCTLVVSLAALNLITPHAPWVETGVGAKAFSL
jgi:adenylate cyclase